MSIIKKGSKNKFLTISPHGFKLLPNRHTTYLSLPDVSELEKAVTLRDMVLSIRTIIKEAAAMGYLPESVIDALRPHTQNMWQKLTISERNQFLHRWRPYWDSIRHRIPMETYLKIIESRASGDMVHIRGRLSEATVSGSQIEIIYEDTDQKRIIKTKVGRMINCTGPSGNIEKGGNRFLANIRDRGIIAQDPLNLGICANPVTFQIKHSWGKIIPHLFGIGTLLRSELWESTSVRELREQASVAADQMLQKIR